MMIVKTIDYVKIPAPNETSRCGKLVNIQTRIKDLMMVDLRKVKKPKIDNSMFHNKTWDIQLLTIMRIRECLSERRS